MKLSTRQAKAVAEAFMRRTPTDRDQEMGLERALSVRVGIDLDDDDQSRPIGAKPS